MSPLEDQSEVLLGNTGRIFLFMCLLCSVSPPHVHSSLRQLACLAGHAVYPSHCPYCEPDVFPEQPYSRGSTESPLRQAAAGTWVTNLISRRCRGAIHPLCPERSISIIQPNLHPTIRHCGQDSSIRHGRCQQSGVRKPARRLSVEAEQEPGLRRWKFLSGTGVQMG